MSHQRLAELPVADSHAAAHPATTAEATAGGAEMTAQQLAAADVEIHEHHAADPRSHTRLTHLLGDHHFTHVTSAVPTPFQKAPSTARAQSHLANERTYLAWVRTAFASIALGIACAKFGGGVSANNDSTGTLQPTPRSLAAGSILVILGGIMVVYGAYRYKRIQLQLEAGMFIVGSKGIELLAVTALVVLIVIAAMLLLFV